jgi:hypothetical protein
MFISVPYSSLIGLFASKRLTLTLPYSMGDEHRSNSGQMMAILPFLFEAFECRNTGESEFNRQRMKLGSGPAVNGKS